MVEAGSPTTINRREAVATLLESRGDLLVVTGLGSAAYDVYAAGDDDRNFYLWGAMGGAAMMGLGLALAQPKKPVAVITGDGEQLMGMGALATIAAKKPANLSIVVLDNGHFGETGMQASHTGLGVDLHRLAEALRYPSVTEIRDLADLASYRSELAKIEGGPRFATIRITAGNVPRILPSRDGVFLKNRFREALGLSVN